MRTIVLAIAFLTPSCAVYGAMAVAPNGVVWLATNQNGIGGAQVEGVYACIPRATSLQCTRMAVDGMPH